MHSSSSSIDSSGGRRLYYVVRCYRIHTCIHFVLVESVTQPSVAVVVVEKKTNERTNKFSRELRVLILILFLKNDLNRSDKIKGSTCIDWSNCNDDVTDDDAPAGRQSYY